MFCWKLYRFDENTISFPAIDIKEDMIRFIKFYNKLKLFHLGDIEKFMFMGRLIVLFYWLNIKYHITFLLCFHYGTFIHNS